MLPHANNVVAGRTRENKDVCGLGKKSLAKSIEIGRPKLRRLTA
jgi:hypothetical protein